MAGTCSAKSHLEPPLRLALSMGEDEELLDLLVNMSQEDDGLDNFFERLANHTNCSVLMTSEEAVALLCVIGQSGRNLASLTEKLLSLV